MPAGLGERDHQGDFVLLISLADLHRLCLAPGDVENVRPEEIIDQNDVGGLRRAPRAQREQLGIARAGADQRDTAGFGGSRLVLGPAPQCIEIGWRGFALWIAERERRECLPEPPPGGRRKPPGLPPLAPPPAPPRPPP